MHERLTRVGLVLLGLPAAVLALWATFDPRGFYDGFPGGSHHWVAVDGPYNEHLVRDFGGLNLGLVVVTVIAIATLTPAVVRAAAGAHLAFGVPHLVYHLRHLDVLHGADKAANAGGLAWTVVLALAVLWVSVRGPARGASPTGARTAPAAAAARSGS